MAGLATSGTLIRWFRDSWRGSRLGGAACAAAEGAPKGANGLLCLPLLLGRADAHPRHVGQGRLLGLDLTHTRGDLFRAVLEGIAAGTAHVLETYREVGAAPRIVYAVGGGTQNAVWVQATSDIGQVTQVVRETDDRGELRRCVPGGGRGGAATRPRTSRHGTRWRGPWSRERGAGLRPAVPAVEGASTSGRRDIRRALGTEA